VTRSELARGAGVDAGYLWRIEAGTERPSLEIYARLANALGADLAARLYPNTGPTIRDRHQAGILESLLSVVNPRWKPYLEIAVRRPSRGWIDVGLHDPRAGIFVAVEIQSELRRLDQLIRWSAEKAASLPSWEGWTRLGDAPTVSQLLIVRETRTNREVAATYRRQLRAAYPADAMDALDALTTATASWPGAAVVWASGRGTAAAPWRIVVGRLTGRAASRERPPGPMISQANRNGRRVFPDGRSTASAARLLTASAALPRERTRSSRDS
jgi:transcriptional regulator with XRE-family HTH domain